MTTKITDYVNQAIELVGSKLSELPAVRALLSAYAKQTQAFEDDVWEVLNGAVYDIDAAIGVQLDRIGVLVGQPRWGRLDGPYRKLIRARIGANVSKGTPEDIIAILLKLLTAPARVIYFQDGIAKAWIRTETVVDPDSDTIFAINESISASKPVGTIINWYAVSVTSIVPPFEWGSDGDGWGVMKLDTRGVGLV